MRRTLLVLSLLALGACASAPEPAKEQASVKVTTLSYPSARTVEQVDSYHGPVRLTVLPPDLAFRVRGFCFGTGR